MIVVLIPCGPTDWHAEGRLLGRVELPLTDAGRRRCDEWVDRLRALNLQRLLHGPDELSTQTAAQLGRRLGVPTKAVEELCEVDIGLWAGLTEAQIKTRYPSAHRELRESPLNVQPPEGEELRQAAHRIATALHRRIRKTGRGPVGIVLRPLSFVLARWVLEGQSPTDVWEAARLAGEPVVLDYSGRPTRAPTGSMGKT